ncbi:hypothetical protein MBA17_18365 [Streptosporangium sp. KLBMP 9127]|nr:hypothetical protein [Streptosporangium sp. KLBMP 9127]
MVVLGAALWAVAVAGAQLGCVDAARAGARAASRGEPVERVRQAVAALAPEGARITVDRAAETTTVKVIASIRPSWGERLPAVDVSGMAVTATEPGAATGAPEETMRHFTRSAD